MLPTEIMNHKTLIKETLHKAFNDVLGHEKTVDEVFKGLEKDILDALTKQEKEIRKAGYQKGLEDGKKNGQYLEREQVIEEIQGLEIMKREKISSANRFRAELRDTLEQLKGEIKQ